MADEAPHGIEGGDSLEGGDVCGDAQNEIGEKVECSKEMEDKDTMSMKKGLSVAFVVGFAGLGVLALVMWACEGFTSHLFHLPLCAGMCALVVITEYRSEWKEREEGRE